MNCYEQSAMSLLPSNDIFISFIMPVFNEEGNIVNVLRNLHSVLYAHPHWKFEVTIIEDGSLDNSRAVMMEELKKYPKTQLILHEKNLGYVRSVKDGIAASHGKYLMYIGADEEFDSSELPDFVNILMAQGAEHADVVLGVRWQRNAYKLFRFFLSVVYIFLLNALFKLRINDYNWSQAWSKEFIDRVKFRSKSLFILPEIIIRAHDLHYKIREIPSNHRGRQAGKSSLNTKIMAATLFEAFEFWWYRRSKKYDPTR